MPKRELSCFLCRELLYEYVAETIDSRRSEAVALHLSDCQECTTEQEGLRDAIKYTRKLAAIEIHPDYLREISNPVPVKSLIARRLGWRSWPDPLKWTVESLVFAGLVALVVGGVGQEFFRANPQTKEIVVVEHPAETVNIAQLPDQTPSEFGEEEFTDHYDVSTTEKRTTPPEPDVKVVQADQELAQTSTPAGVHPQEPAQSSISRNQMGFLYRTQLRVANLEGVTNELIAKIESLNGKKAGEVPLGWKRPTGSYFHFSMPEANYPLLSEFMKKYGGPSIVKEKNPRVMPQGTIRMIIEVDSLRQSSVAAPVVDEPTTMGDVSEESEKPLNEGAATAAPEPTAEPTTKFEQLTHEQE